LTLAFEDNELGVIPIAIVKDATKAHRKMFELALKVDSKNDEKLHSLKVRHSNLKSTLDEHNKSVKTIIDEKVNLENRLYGQFLPLLRAKDEKVNQLQEKIETLRQYSSNHVFNSDPGSSRSDTTLNSSGEELNLDTSQSPDIEISQNSRQEVLNSESSGSPVSITSQSSSDFELNLESSQSPACVTLSSSESEDRNSSNNSISILN